jgi:VWFA-related protein
MEGEIMGQRLVFHAHVLTLAAFLAFCTTALAQERERPKLKDFGSSLRQTKSDPKKKAEVESKPKPSPKSKTGDIDVVKVETSLVTTDVLVLDAKGNPVTGLTPKDFAISEDGQQQQVGMLLLGDDVKVARSIVLIIDYSSSQFPFIQTSIVAAKALVDKLPASDSMAIVTDDVELIQDFTTDKLRLKSKLDSLLSRTGPIYLDSVSFPMRHFGKSKQYSALLATLNEAFNNEDQRPIVIFQTDGDQLGFLKNSPLTSDFSTFGNDKKAAEKWRKRFEEMRVDFSLDDISRAAEKARATVYTVIPGHQILGRTANEQIALVRTYLRESMIAYNPGGSSYRKQIESLLTDEKLKPAVESQTKTQAALAAVSTSTGGWAMFLEEPNQADHIYSSILADINRRYIVGYYPSNKEHDGKRRKVEVAVRDHPEYSVAGRKWYYAPAPDQ